MTEKKELKALSVIESTRKFKASVIPYFKVPFRPLRGNSLKLDFNGEQISIPTVDLSMWMDMKRIKNNRIIYPVFLFVGPETIVLPIIDNYGIADFRSPSFLAKDVYVHSSLNKEGDVEYSVITNETAFISQYDKRVFLLDESLPYVKKCLSNEINEKIDFEEVISLRVGVDFEERIEYEHPEIAEDGSQESSNTFYCYFTDRDLGKKYEPYLVNEQFHAHENYAGYVLKLDIDEVHSSFVVKESFDFNNKMDLNYFGQMVKFFDDFSFEEQLPDVFPPYIKKQIMDIYEKEYCIGFITRCEFLNIIYQLVMKDFKERQLLLYMGNNPVSGLN